MFIHALTGCNTTSCFYNRGKNSVLKLFEERSKVQGCLLKNAVESFREPDQPKTTISNKGMICLLEMCKVPKNINNINEYRYLRFTTGVSGNKAVKLESLPPTADAAKQHFFRVYLQVQRWLSRDLPANVWGWAE